MTVSKANISVLLLAGIFMLSCRGQVSEKPPVHPNQNMDFQNRFNAQEANPFFENNMAMRMPVEGTIAQGKLRLDDAYFEGLDENGEYITENPFERTQEFLYRGKDRFEVFCKVCHGGLGDGQGVIMAGAFGFVPAPSFHTELSRNMPDGQIYSAITHGIRTMPSYATQIKVEDRWAIVAYIRALQRSQNVPESEMDRYDVDLAQLRSENQAEQERLQAVAEARSRTGAGGSEVSAELGEQMYVRNGCQACHSTDGTQILGPTFSGLYGSEKLFTDGSSLVVDEEYLTESIVDPAAKIVDGFDNVMPPFNFLAENEIQSIVEFIKSLSEDSEE